MQTRNRLFDDISRAMNGAAGLAGGMKREIEHIVRGRVEALLANMDLVRRDEYEALEAYCSELESRLCILEDKFAEKKPQTPARKKKDTPKRGKPAS